MTPIEIISDGTKYLFVGEAPGEEEERYRIPLVGASGQEFYRMLEQAGWLPVGAASRIINALHVYFDPETHKLTLNHPDFSVLKRELYNAHISTTNVCHTRPPRNDIGEFFLPRSAKRSGVCEYQGRYCHEYIKGGIDQLSQTIIHLNPQVIIALGGTALWALTACDGITKWRGSILSTESSALKIPSTKVIPTFHPADVLRTYEHRPIVIRDLKRAYHERDFREIRKPVYSFLVKPSYKEARDALAYYAEPRFEGTPIASDIETPWGWRNLPGHVACIGFADSSSSASCIPLMCMERLEGYWTHAEEVDIVLAVRRVLTRRTPIFHKSVFEVMHFTKHWGFVPGSARRAGAERIPISMPPWHDTMIMQHILFPGLLDGRIDPVSGKVGTKRSSLTLSFIASMYCEYYRFWKDDGRDWNQKEVPDEVQWWNYNCEDCVRTFECFEVLRASLEKSALWAPYETHMSFVPVLVSMMLRGMNVALTTRDEYRTSVNRDAANIEKWLGEVLGHDLNVGSAPQMKSLFYSDFGQAPIYKGRGPTKTITVDKTALDTISKRTPILAPLCEAIEDLRSLNTFRTNVLNARVSTDGRMRTEINPCGTESLRFSSTETPFGEGLNMQNLARMEE